MPLAHDIDGRVRLAAFEFLTQQCQTFGEVLPRTVLSNGFDFEGKRVPFLGPQGIFKPAILPRAPLTIFTTPRVPGKDAPYDDDFGADGLLRYRYRGTDAQHHENVGLRVAMLERLPLIYIAGITPSRYMPVWPAYIVGDDPKNLSFSVAIDEKVVDTAQPSPDERGQELGRRIYVTTTVQRRVHQRSFRERVIDAYTEHCAICKLRHNALLEAAHILPDGHPNGLPIVPNGLALCKLHHAAFDAHILGIRPDFVVEIRQDILDEVDGPMLQHGLKGFHGERIRLPRAEAMKPNRNFLEERYAWFKRCG